jgi:hypothetical protein
MVPTRRTVFFLSLRSLARTEPPPSVSPIGPEDHGGKFCPDVKRKCDPEGRVPDQQDAQLDEPGSRRLVGRSGGTADALGWYLVRPHSRCVDFISFHFSSNVLLSLS